MSSAKRRVTKAQYETLASFRYALRLFLRFSEDAAKSVGLTPQQHQALLAIKGFPGRDSVSVGELAERLQLRHHSAVGLIDRLSALDLLQRQPSDQDRRQVDISLTAKGEKLLETLSTTHHSQLEKVAPHITGLLEQLTRSGQDVVGKM
jgi:DNA-binding MarR family transcriptional regulator